MTFPLAKFRPMFPAFDDTADAVIYGAADMARCYLPKGCGDCEEQLWMLATAHLLKLRQDEAGGNAAAGAVQSATVGRVTVTLAQPSGGRSEQAQWFAMSPYGLQFLALRKRCAGVPRYVGGGGASLPWR